MSQTPSAARSTTKPTTEPATEPTAAPRSEATSAAAPGPGPGRAPSSSAGTSATVSSATSVAAPRGWKAVLRLITLGVIFVAVPASLALATVWLVPEGNDYALATRLKHERLAGAGATRSKVVFVGGSNLAYGQDSAALEDATGRYVVNMGMNGYFGVRFMLEEVKPDLRAGDLVVMAFEYDSFYKSADGTASDLLMAVKARPENLAFLTWSQRLDVLQAVPYVAQHKLVRLVREVGRGARDWVRGYSAEDPTALFDRIESLAGFEARGDLVSHRGVEWADAPNPGYDLSHLEIDAGVIARMQEFARVMREAGVTVFVSYSPVAESFYGEHQGAIRRLHETLRTASLEVPSPPEAFVMPDAWFFDTVYHLKEERRHERARRLLGDIEAALGAATAPGVVAVDAPEAP